MSGNVSFPDAAKAARRMAEQNGVTIDVVFAKFRQGVRKSAVSYTDFFGGKGDISLGRKKMFVPGRGRGLPRGCGAVAAKNLNGGR